jgi:putative drug exporter of the RND superfamily
LQTTLFGRLGSFAVRRRWWVIAAWAVLLVAMGVFAPGLPKRLSPGGFEVPGSEGLAVQQKLRPSQRRPGHGPCAPTT